MTELTRPNIAPKAEENKLDCEQDCAIKKTVPPQLWRERFDVCCNCEEDCDCSSSSGETSNCIQDAIDKQDKLINEAESAKKAKEELKQLLEKATQVAKGYTASKHRELTEKWNKQDELICKLLQNLKCAVPDWQYVIRCHVCPILNALYLAEQDLYGDPIGYCKRLVKRGEGGALPREMCEPDCAALLKEVPNESWKPKKWCDWYRCFRDSPAYKNASSIAVNHHALRHWLDRDYYQKRKTFELVKQVVSVWEKPVELIAKALEDNAKLIDESLKGLSDRGTHVVYDVFMKLIPMHMAIGPRPAENNNETPPTNILECPYRKFLSEVCSCGEVDAMYCCYNNVGELSFRDRLIGPQPFIAPPNKYFEIVCCLATCRYLPAQEQMASAKAALEAKDSEIARIEKFIADGLKDFEQNAKRAIPVKVEPCKKNGKSTQTAEKLEREEEHEEEHEAIGQRARSSNSPNDSEID